MSREAQVEALLNDVMRARYQIAEVLSFLRDLDGDLRQTLQRLHVMDEDERG